jgi:hypothetical protein
LLRQIGEGLAAAHAKNLIHRDINPKNVLLGPDNRPKIVDFDFTRTVIERAHNTEYAGTRFSAPEAFDPDQSLGVTADIFSLSMLGVSLYSVDEIPQDRYNHDDLRALIHDLPCRPRLRFELARATDWQPKRRHPSMEGFLKALGQATQRDPRSRGLRPFVEFYWSIRLLFQRQRKVAIAAALVVLLATLATLWTTLDSLRCPTSTVPFREGDSITAYHVPDHCTVIHVQAWGGGGGGALLTGGGGGFAAAQFRVRAGDQLSVFVGGGGGSWAVGDFPKNTGGAFGGRGGYAGASSGGYSGVQHGSTWLLVAGGGGGAGASGHGGGGGGPSGQDGGPESTLHGRGGMITSGGQGGTSYFEAKDGDPGNAMKGGAGGQFKASKQGDANSGVGGGGGGGGHMAGGGGGGDSRPLYGPEGQIAHSGGGGGGSGYINESRIVAGTAELLTANGQLVPRTDHPHYRDNAERDGNAKRNDNAGRGGDPRFTSEATAGNDGRVVISTVPHITWPWQAWD